MKIAIALIFALPVALLGCSSAPKSGTAEKGPLYHRLYQGHRLHSIKPAAFEDKINRDFLPLFAQAATVGLHSYRPAMPAELRGCDLPDWVALLTFDSEAAYDRYRDTPIGVKIREAHAPVFESTSKSLVPEPYHNTILPDRAYSLTPAFGDYRLAESALLIHCSPRAPEVLLADLNQLYGQGSQAANILFAVSPRHLVEYVFARTPVELETTLIERGRRLKGIYRRSTLIRLEKQKVGATPLHLGQGIDAQW